MAFNPYVLTTNLSMNRLTIADVPEYGFPDELKGYTGYQLVSTKALVTLLRQHLDELEFPESMSDYDLLSGFYGLLSMNDDVAVRLAEAMGRRMGYLLLALKRGDDCNRETQREHYPDEYWDYWQTIQTVHLGGGLVSGAMGQIMATQSLALVRQYDSSFVVDVATHPRQLPIVGAARFVESGDNAYVFDFGSTYVKRALVTYGKAGLETVNMLPPLPVAVDLDVTQDKAQTIFERMLEIIIATYQPTDADTIPISLSAYVDENGQPLLTQRGIYMHIARLHDTIQQHMSDILSQRLGCSIKVRLLHDGTVAAAFYAPELNAAVIAIGTALGFGFPVPRPNLRPVATTIKMLGEHGE